MINRDMYDIIEIHTMLMITWKSNDLVKSTFVLVYEHISMFLKHRNDLICIIIEKSHNS